MNAAPLPEWSVYFATASQMVFFIGFLCAALALWISWEDWKERRHAGEDDQPD